MKEYKGYGCIFSCCESEQFTGWVETVFHVLFFQDHVRLNKMLNSVELPRVGKRAQERGLICHLLILPYTRQRAQVTVLYPSATPCHATAGQQQWQKRRSRRCRSLWVEELEESQWSSISPSRGSRSVAAQCSPVKESLFQSHPCLRWAPSSE